MVQLTSVKGLGQKTNHGDWKKLKRGVKREECQVRPDFANNDAVLGRCSFDFDDEGHSMELAFETAKSVKLEGTRKKSQARKKVSVKEAQKLEVMWTPSFGLLANVSKTAFTGIL